MIDISPLKNAILYGYFDDMSSFFNKNIIYKNEILSKIIEDEFYFFTFYSQETSLESYHSELMKRVDIVFRYYNDEDKLKIYNKILMEKDEELDFKILKLIDLNKVDDNNKDLFDIILHSFSFNKFDLLKYIENCKSNNIYHKENEGKYYYMEKYSYGFVCDRNNNNYSIAKQMLLTYSKERLLFLIEKNVRLPDAKDINELSRNIKNLSRASEFLLDLLKINFKKMNRDLLKDKLEQKANGIKIKI